MWRSRPSRHSSSPVGVTPKAENCVFAPIPCELRFRDTERAGRKSTDTLLSSAIDNKYNQSTSCWPPHRHRMVLRLQAHHWQRCTMRLYPLPLPCHGCLNTSRVSSMVQTNPMPRWVDIYATSWAQSPTKKAGGPRVYKTVSWWGISPTSYVDRQKLLQDWHWLGVHNSILYPKDCDHGSTSC